MQLSTTNPRDRVLIECISLRMRSILINFDVNMPLNEELREVIERKLLEQKAEYPHNYDISVEIRNDEGRPTIAVIVGGLELFTIG